MNARRDLMIASEYKWSEDAEPFPDVIPRYTPSGIEDHFLTMAKEWGLE